MKKIGSKILQFLPFLFLILAILLIVQIVVSVRNEKTPTIFGYSMFLVVSPSMEDVIMTGDLIFVDTKADEFNVGDIISFREPGDETNIITHEIIDIDYSSGVPKYTTKGVNNHDSLSWEIGFDGDQIIGKYVGKSGFLGDVYRILFTGGMNFIYAIVILVFMMIAIMEVNNIVKEVRLHKSKELSEARDKLVQEELEKLRKAAEDKKEEN